MICVLPPRARLRTARRRGAAAVEFAVVSMVFFTFLLAAIELGRGLMVNYSVVNAARQGARAGMPPSVSTSTITTATSDALTRVGVSGATVSVLVNGSATEASSAQTGALITVSVSIPVASFSWLPFTRYLTGSLTGKYTLVRE